MAYTLINTGTPIRNRLNRRSSDRIKYTNDFSGNFLFNGTRFTYMVIIAPYTANGGKMMKKILLERKDTLDPTRTKTCLELTSGAIKNYDNNARLQTSAFFIVYAPNILDTGSGTLQIYNQCTKDRDTINTAQAWINDVCRSYPVGIVKSVVSPVTAMFYLIEQLVSKNLKKTETRMMVSVDNVGVLEIYKKSGYIIMPELPKCDVSHDKIGNRHYYIVHKPGLVYDGLINDELFNIDLPVALSPPIVPLHNTLMRTKKSSGGKRTKYKRSKRSKRSKRRQL